METSTLNSDIVIVTRHTGLVEWLARRGITGNVMTHVAPEETGKINGMTVVGVLPLNLAALTASIITVDMPGLKPEQRGKDLTADEIDAAGGRLSRYLVVEVPVGKL